MLKTLLTLLLKLGLKHYEVEDAPFVKVRQVITYGAFAYINRIIFDYDELKKEKKDIPPIEDIKFCFGAKINGENLLKD